MHRGEKRRRKAAKQIKMEAAEVQLLLHLCPAICVAEALVAGAGSPKDQHWGTGGGVVGVELG